LGYLDDKKGRKENSTLFDSVCSVDKVLNNMPNTSTKVVMIDLFAFDLDTLPLKVNTKIDGIRLAFHKKDINNALEASKKIIDLGYQLFFQPMVTKNYNGNEFITLIKKANALNVHAFYVVDSFGSMTLGEFRKYINLADENLDEDIKLGYHSHNNMQLAFSNAIDLCDSQLNREVIIDSSIYGMGRGAGNLNTELIIDYLNNNHNKKYETCLLLEVIDEILVFYFKQNPWGFSPAQYLSASLDCHPSYASYLVNKKSNHIADIFKVLENVPLELRGTFNEKVVNRLYQDFLLTNKSEPRGEFNIPGGKKLLLIASGNSINNNLEKIKQKIESGDYFAIALNHKPQFECDCYFFSNQQRFDEFKNQIPLEKQNVTTNIFCKEGRTVIELKDVAYIGESFVTNVVLLMINYLISKKVKNVEIAGLDGYEIGRDSYAYNETSVVENKGLFKELNQAISKSLLQLKDRINIELITPSIYGRAIPLRILGVIPARYNSSRFQGKPLCLINNVPMIKRTYDRVKKSELLDKLVVATDDLKIKEYCEKENIPVVMTSDKHLTGTDRLAEVAQKEHYDLYINIQGDEPIIDYHSINQIVDDYQKNSQSYAVYNLYKKITSKDEVNSNTIIKVVVNQNDELMYMSRNPIPFNKSTNEAIYNKQVCVYGFTKKALEVFSNRSKSHNERFEDIELLRFLDLGYPVKMLETTVDSIAVDVPDDIKKVEDFLKQNNLS
jgi:3-deoxy-D-manno-octulosonate cytidylyltransferase